MSCCGTKRAAASAEARAERAPARGRGLASPPAEAPVAPGDRGHAHRGVRYIGLQPLSLTGPVSGRVYHFAMHDARTVVDGRDFEALLRTDLFVDHAG